MTDKAGLMQIKLPYGKSYFLVDIPADSIIIKTKNIPAVSDPQLAVRRALKNPTGSPELSQICTPQSKVAVVVNDITRPTPSYLLLPEIIRELSRGGVNKTNIIIIVAAGNHRPNTPEELQGLLGAEIADGYKIINHNCRDNLCLSYLGNTIRGLPIHVNSYLASADVKILTGTIAVHHSMGYGGGRKSILPGVIGQETLNIHHSFPLRPYKPAMGWIDGNGFHEEAVEAARMAGVDFILNVIQNDRKQVSRVVAGDSQEAFLEGVKYLDDRCKVKISEESDITITSPGGYPKDINLHQAQKAVSAAEMFQKKGGVIILAAECQDGIGKFKGWLQEARSPEQVIERFKSEGFTSEHSGKAMMWARALVRHRIIIVTDGISEEDLKSMFFERAASVEHALKMAGKNPGDNRKILVLPYATDLIPVLRNSLNPKATK